MIYLNKDQNKLSRWVHCNILYTVEQSKWMTCPKAGIFIDYRGRVIADHLPDTNWSIEDFFGFLRKNGVSWKRIFWKIWGRLTTDECTEWGSMFAVADYNKCSYHTAEPIFGYGSNTGYYPWWSSEAVRFSTGVNAEGWQNKSHSFKLMKSDSIEYIYFNKHFEYLKETDSVKHNQSLTSESK